MTRDSNWQESARGFAEWYMMDSYGDWDRNDQILIGIFYQKYIYYIESHYDLIPKK